MKKNLRIQIIAIFTSNYFLKSKFRTNRYFFKPVPVYCGCGKGGENNSHLTF